MQAWKLLEKMRRLFRVVSLESSYRDTTKDACLLVSHGALALLLNLCAAAHVACALLATRLTQEVTALYTRGHQQRPLHALPKWVHPRRVKERRVAVPLEQAWVRVVVVPMAAIP